MRLLSVVFIVFLSTTLSAEQRVSITIEERDTPHKESIQKAGDLLLKACPGILIAWTDIESANAQYIKENYLAMTDERYGWKQAIVFTFKVKDDTRVLPDELRIWGHTVEYILGAGNNPGVATIKTEGQLLCGKMRPSTNGSIGFLSIADMAFLNKH